MTREQYMQKKVPELREMAAALHIPASQMRKAELIDALMAHQADVASQEEPHEAAMLRPSSSVTLAPQRRPESRAEKSARNAASSKALTSK